MYYKKVCILGAREVGKTSLIQRYLNGSFSTVYQTRGGTQIDKSVVEIERDKVQLMLWDVQGDDQVSPGFLNYIKGASAMIYVVDGTRLETLPAAVEYRLEAEHYLGRRVPSLMLFNKSDLAASWEINADMISAAESGGVFAFLTSCQEGSGIGTAFNLIIRVMLGKTTLMPEVSIPPNLHTIDSHFEARF